MSPRNSPELPKEKDDGEIREVVYTTTKEYYKDGHLLRVKEYIDDDIQSIIVYDKNGDLILDAKYINGLITTKENK